MAQDQPLLAVREALRGCFPAVQEQQRRWRGALGDCQPLLAALGSLAEQLQAAQVARLDDAPPLRAFPGLRERLRRKQLEAGDDVLDKLGETLATLLKVRDVVSRHVEQVFEVYEQHADAIGIDAVQRASAVSPSVADMLEWLQDIERHYRNAYLKRKYLLSSIQWGDLANIQALPKAWDQISEDEHQSLVQGAGFHLLLHVCSVCVCVCVCVCVSLTSLEALQRCPCSASVFLINLMFCILWRG
uniref:AFG2 interacting ribosome maturation factor n=1 Tax=Canis lupus dingo TaxID=286419 RepID=A0A8C0QX43_CANLU